MTAGIFCGVLMNSTPLKLASVGLPVNHPKDVSIHDELEFSLERYATWVAQAEPQTAEFTQFREMWPARFMELCKFHLSMLIDLPLEFFDSTEDDLCRNNSSSRHTSDYDHEATLRAFYGTVRWPRLPWSRLLSGAHHSCPNSVSDLEPPRSTSFLAGRAITNAFENTKGGCANSPFLKNILILMETLDSKTHLSVEGIFRKSGNVVRQRTIKQLILGHNKPFSLEELNEPGDGSVRTWTATGRTKSTQTTRKWIQSSFGQQNEATTRVNVHDLAAGLKAALHDLPEPLLTHKLLPLFVQVSSLTNGRVDERGNCVKLRPVEEKIAKAKQLKALRLLCLLLPEPHMVLFKRLLLLLEHTLEHTESNRMTKESLGTIFAPLLLSTSKVPPRDLHIQYDSLAKLATVLICQGAGLWMVPKSFAQDLHKNRILLEAATSLSYGKRDSHTDSCSSHSSQRNLGLDCCLETHSLQRSTSTDSGLGWTDGGQKHCESDVPIVTGARVKLADDDLPPLVTCVKFATPSNVDMSVMNVRSPGLNETDYAVAELYALVQSMSDDDPRKRRLIHRFNAANGGLTPFVCPVNNNASHLTNEQHNSPTCLHAISGSFCRPNTSNTAYRAAKNLRSSLRVSHQCLVNLCSYTVNLSTIIPFLFRFFFSASW
ncbi:unnamed protein product [Dicrocoelium dendriticum]|nr:unnamed protein product [Dicrocoelium dendriticum]